MPHDGGTNDSNGRIILFLSNETPPPLPRGYVEQRQVARASTRCRDQLDFLRKIVHEKKVTPGLVLGAKAT